MRFAAEGAVFAQATMDPRTQGLGRMFAGMQVSQGQMYVPPQGHQMYGAQGQQMYGAPPPDTSWRKDVPTWFLPALTGASPRCSLEPARLPGATIFRARSRPEACRW